MCVIIIKQKERRVPLSTLELSAQINPHGLGIVWLDTWEVSYHKSKEYEKLDTDRPFIAHFRYATVGKVNKDNTHPFRCGKKAHEFLMMNGTIPGIGSSKMCDSRVLAESMGDVPRHKWKSVLEKHNNVRFVTIDTKSRTFQVYNKNLWTIKDGIWYSKPNVIRDIKVAVYGTLKKGNSNYYNYLTKAEYVGTGRTADKYPLIITGLPYLLPNRGIGYNVVVDVFNVSQDILDRLDMLEGHPKWYCRKEIEIRLANGTTQTCWIYFNNKKLSPGDILHETFVQQWRGASHTHYPSYNYNKPTWTPSYRQLEFDSLEDSIEIEEEDLIEEIEKESPFCLSCYRDLEHDGFNNWHCVGCGEWYSDADVEAMI